MLYAQNKADKILLVVMPLAQGTYFATYSADLCPWFLDPSWLAASQEVDGMGPVGDGTIDSIDSFGGQGRYSFKRNVESIRDKFVTILRYVYKIDSQEVTKLTSENSS